MLDEENTQITFQDHRGEFRTYSLSWDQVFSLRSVDGHEVCSLMSGADSECHGVQERRVLYFVICMWEKV